MASFIATKRISSVTGARMAKLPPFIEPQLATLVREPPSGDEWLHELKFDGYRMLCRIDRGRVTFWSRNGKEWTQKFKNVIEAVKSLNISSAIIDGEIVIVDAQGRSSFQKLQRATPDPQMIRFAVFAYSSNFVEKRRP
jgi:bifunctional non-homologous end joining protein LigD